MAKYLITMERRTVWEFEIEADSEKHALDLISEWGEDDMKDEEIVNSSWNINIDLKEEK